MTDTDSVRPWLDELATALVTVSGVEAVLLGGSRARGEHAPDSDYDLGLYYRPPLDTGTLRALARRVVGPDADVSEPGDWGPWVDGGAWLGLDGRAVDWIYRDVGRVDESWRRAQRGEYAFHPQWGHPLGVPDFAYAGEVALGAVLNDPSGRLTELHDATQHYPPALTAALVAGVDEADFLLGVLRKSIARADPVWVATTLGRVVLLCVHALHGRAGRWLINEKGALASAEGLAVTPPGFTTLAREITGAIGATTDELARSVGAAGELVATAR